MFDEYINIFFKRAFWILFVVWIVLFLQPETCPLCYSHLSLNLSFCVQDAVFFSCGDSLSSKGMTYLTNSLFDYRSPENNGVRAEFILDAANHKVTITRSLCYFTQKYYTPPTEKKTTKWKLLPFSGIDGQNAVADYVFHIAILRKHLPYLQ